MIDRNQALNKIDEITYKLECLKKDVEEVQHLQPKKWVNRALTRQWTDDSDFEITQSLKRQKKNTLTLLTKSCNLNIHLLKNPQAG